MHAIHELHGMTGYKFYISFDSKVLNCSFFFFLQIISSLVANKSGNNDNVMKTQFLNFFFKVGVRISLCVSRLIPRALKLTIM